MNDRFVILEHDHPYLHWDFLLDTGQELKSWRLLSKPITEVWLAAEELPDHRRIYLDYEGEVSGNRGSVKRILSGCYLRSSDTRHGEFGLTITDCDFCKLAIHRLSQTGTPEWRFE